MNPDLADYLDTGGRVTAHQRGQGRLELKDRESGAWIATDTPAPIEQ